MHSFDEDQQEAIRSANLTAIIQYLDGNGLSYDVHRWGSFDYIEIIIYESVDGVNVSRCCGDSIVQFWVTNRDDKFELDELMLPESFAGVKWWDPHVIQPPTGVAASPRDATLPCPSGMAAAPRDAPLTAHNSGTHNGALLLRFNPPGG